MFKRRELERWINEAKRTLQSAQSDLDSGYYEWASFKAQQSAELATKGILRALGIASTDHSVTRLLKELENFCKVPKELLNLAMELDRNYIAPRYPDAYAEGSPFEYYSEEIAKRLISYAEKIISFVECTANEFGSP
ncbi:MAG: HEPN domain-containing protein [Candidatus Bathyarchaeota archaeon]